ncbi:MAG: hypothetical protein ACR2KG_06875 [Nocardioidaceae bacterium]
MGRLSLPSVVAAQLVLEPGERPLAWASGAHGEWYVGTDRAIHLPAGSGYRSLRWERIARADWRSDADELAIVEVAEWGRCEPRTQLWVADPGRLLELLRERVTKSVVCTVFASVQGRRGLSVVGRRSPIGNRPVVWCYVLSEGLDPSDPLVVETAERTLAQARAELFGL